MLVGLLVFYEKGAFTFVAELVDGRALLAAGSEGFVGGAEERGGFVEYDREGNIAQEAFEFPLVLEGVEENAVFHFFENFDGDAAGNVEAAERQNFQSEISGFSTIDGGPEIEGV